MWASRFKGDPGRIFKIFNSCYTCRSHRPQLNKALPLICWGMGRSQGSREEVGTHWGSFRGPRAVVIYQ